jgi:hypothetical protein
VGRLERLGGRGDTRLNSERSERPKLRIKLPRAPPVLNAPALAEKVCTNLPINFFSVRK